MSEIPNIIWIDENIEGIEISGYIQELKALGYFKIKTFKKVKDAINHIKEIQFEDTITIVSGNLYFQFIDKFQENLNDIYIIPKIIIFTSDEKKKFLHKNKNKLNYIDDPFYNCGGIRASFDDVKKFVINPLENNEKFFKKDDEGKLSFDYIDTKEKLALPLFYKLLIDFSPKESEKFNEYLYENYNKKSPKINTLLDSIYKMKNIPIQLLSKYYSRIYTDDKSHFYSDLNKDLRNNKKEHYLPFIKVLYEGVKLKSLPIANYDELYRGAKLSDEEINKIKTNYDKGKIKGLPGAIIFSKTFLSFSKNLSVAEEFSNQNSTVKTKEEEKGLSKVLFILEKDDKLDFSLSTHADIEKLSIFPKEREVLFFPFSSFEIKKIEVLKDNSGEKIYRIRLLYLGKYLKEFIKDEEIAKGIINKSNIKNMFLNKKNIVANTEFEKEIIEFGLIKPEKLETNDTTKLINIYMENKRKYDQTKEVYNPVIPSFQKDYIIRRFKVSSNDHIPPNNSIISIPPSLKTNLSSNNLISRNLTKINNSPSNSLRNSNSKIIHFPTTFSRSNSFKDNENNFIIGKLYIGENDINKNIRIINSFEEIKRKYNYYKVDNELRFYNEKEIMENCQIEINEKRKKFSYFIKASKPGIITIKYIFKSNLKKTDFMFSECTNLIELDLMNFSTKDITNMSCMFFQCTSLKDLKLRHYYTNVIDMNCMFYGCVSLTNLDLSCFLTDNVLNMSRMFFGCKSLRNINLSSFNTQKVGDMYGMFCGCESLENLNLLNFSTQNVVNMTRMFFGCKSLNILDLSKFNTNKVAYMNSMFYGCLSLKKLNLLNFDTKNVVNMDDMFIGCLSLKVQNIICKNNLIRRAELIK